MIPILRTLTFLFVLCFVSAQTLDAQAPDRSAPPPVSPAPEFELPPIQSRTISNGVDVLFIEKSDLPLIQLNVVIEVGTADDPADRSGLASLTAAMVDEGAGQYDALALEDAFEFLGARFSVSSSYHHTTLSLRVPSERFEPAVELLADVLLRPHFDPAELVRLRNDRLTTLIRRHDEPNAIADALFNEAIYGASHPYGRSEIGNADFLHSVTSEELDRFHSRYYTPARASIVMAGDISPDDFDALDRVLQDWTHTGAPTTQLPTAPQVASLNILLVDVPGAAQSVIQIGRIGVPRTTDDYHALSVLNTVLGGSFTSRLNQNLREDKGYTYGARSSFDFRSGAGPFRATASVFTDVTAPALREFIYELRRIHDPLADDEIDLAKNFLSMRYPQQFQSVSGIAGHLAELVRFDLPPSTLTEYTDRIQHVTRHDAEAAADRYLDPDGLAVVVVGDRAQIEEDIRALDLGPVTVLEVTDVLGPVPELEQDPSD